MENTRIYDLAGLGIGPFNLGLAALDNDIPGLNTIYFDQRAQFDWHKGMMIEGTTLQVPFFADLVTLANPCSRFSFLSFLKAQGRLFHFAIRESNVITRAEYNHYCNWAIAQLSNLNFNHEVKAVEYDHALGCYKLHLFNTKNEVEKIVHAKRLVIGIGTVPSLPEFARKLQGPNLFHSGEYLFHKETLMNSGNISIIGSGQSAAEIFYDLLQQSDRFTGCQWFTRSGRFFPMEYSKLTLEMTSPDYIDYFFNLKPGKKEEVLSKQKMLYKGINFDLVGAIYDCLYQKTINAPALNIGLYTNCELRDIATNSDGSYLLSFYHKEQQQYFRHTSAAVVLATGYQPQVPAFLEPIANRIRWNAKGQYDVQRNYSIDTNSKEIFVQNAELHTHGFTAPDLGMGAYRNAVILNEIMGCEHFKLDKNIAFQTFGIPPQAPQPGSSAGYFPNNFQQPEPSVLSDV